MAIVDRKDLVLRLDGGMMEMIDTEKMLQSEKRNHKVDRTKLIREWILDGLRRCCAERGETIPESEAFRFIADDKPPKPYVKKVQPEKRAAAVVREGVGRGVADASAPEVVQPDVRDDVLEATSGADATEGEEQPIGEIGSVLNPIVIPSGSAERGGGNGWSGRNVRRMGGVR